ncbi:MAG TPA: cation-transporting P-type ATPase, partial [Cyanobium sp.]|nr:cation-transporting P-type ATPase [Cyanobium sp.]
MPSIRCLDPEPPFDAAPAWHALTAEECLAALQVGDDGLSSSEAAERLTRQGLNRLELPPGRSDLRILLDQFANVMQLLLLGVAVVSVGLAVVERQFPRDPIAIVLIVV